jgi:cyclopropane fatty-acyl-phospholipid synthase-like methyltransferase
MSISRRLFFNFSYFRKPPWDTGISPPELLAHIASHPSGRALDLGCGTGTNVITLAKAGWQVTGIDFVRRAIQVARRKVRQAGVNADLRVGDVTRLDDLRGPFDLILDIGCYHGLSTPGKQAYRENICNLLAPTGNFLMYSIFRQEAGAGPGMLEEDVRAFFNDFDLMQRQDGQDRRDRRSAWFTFRKKQPANNLDPQAAKTT